MGNAKDNIEKAYKWALENGPKVGRFPYLAEALRQAGVLRYVYNLPSCQCIYFTQYGNVAAPAKDLISAMTSVPQFEKEAFIKVLRAAQQGEISFPEFIKGSWETGVINYEADLVARKVSYFGAERESYVEDFPAVEVKM